MAYLTSGCFALARQHLGEDLGAASASIIPQVFAYYCFQTNCFFHCRHEHRWAITYSFLKIPMSMGWMLSITLGVPQHLPSTWNNFRSPRWPSQSFLPSIAQGHVGDTKIFCSDLAFLLVSALRKLLHGRDDVQTFHGVGTSLPNPHLYFGWGSAKKLTLLTTSSKNYGLCLCAGHHEDAQRVPLPKKGHLSTMIEGAPSRITYRHLQPTRNMSTLTVRMPSGLPRGAEQGPRASSTISTRISCPWDEYAQRTYIPTSGPIPVHSRQPCAQGLSPQQHFNSNLLYTVPPWNIP